MHEQKLTRPDCTALVTDKWKVQRFLTWFLGLQQAKGNIQIAGAVQSAITALLHLRKSQLGLHPDEDFSSTDPAFKSVLQGTTAATAILKASAQTSSSKTSRTLTDSEHMQFLRCAQELIRVKGRSAQDAAKAACLWAVGIAMVARRQDLQELQWGLIGLLEPMPAQPADVQLSLLGIRRKQKSKNGTNTGHEWQAITEHKDPLMCPVGYLADLAIWSNDHLLSEMIANTDHEQRSWWEERMFASEPAKRFEPVSDTYMNRMFANLWQTAEETAALSVEGAVKFEQKQAALHLLRSRGENILSVGYVAYTPSCWQHCYQTTGIVKGTLMCSASVKIVSVVILGCW